jgi:hypothetical protein
MGIGWGSGASPPGKIGPFGVAEFVQVGQDGCLWVIVVGIDHPFHQVIP